MNTTTNGCEHQQQRLAVLPACWLCYGCAACGRAVRWRRPEFAPIGLRWCPALVEHLVFALGLCRVRGAGQRRCGAAGKGHGRGCEPRDAALLERQTVRVKCVRVPWQPACKRPPRRGPYLGDEPRCGTVATCTATCDGLHGRRRLPDRDQILLTPSGSGCHRGRGRSPNRAVGIRLAKLIWRKANKLVPGI